MREGGSKRSFHRVGGQPKIQVAITWSLRNMHKVRPEDRRCAGLGLELQDVDPALSPRV